MMLRFVIAIVAIAMGMGTAIAMANGGHDTPPTTTGGGHTEVSVCHKPGTPAQMTLTFDDDGYEAHLAHGDTRGACGTTPPVDPCETSAAAQYDECDTPTETTPTTPTVTTPVDRCPPGMVPTNGKDGEEGNDECEYPQTPTTPTTTTPTVATTPVTTTPAVTATTPTPTLVTPPKVVVKKATPKAKKPFKPTKQNTIKTPKPDAPKVCKKGYRMHKNKCYPIVMGSG